MPDYWTIALGLLVGIVAVAMIVQIALWLAIYGVARRVQARVQRSMTGVRELSKLSREMIAENQDAARGIAGHSAAIGKMVLQDARVIGRFSEDLRHGIHTEREHAGVVIEDARRRVSETAQIVNRGVTAPFRGVAQGIHRAVRFFEQHAA
ncbi:MAG TPA: hypothetical protein VMB85_00470 [Bryobacteraceae bacterium]|nr:hypothetical protein [Bryobacteraceae bacterium]